MKTEITWNDASVNPEHDVMIALVAIKETNNNHQFYLKMGMKSHEFNQYVIPATYVFTTQRWMSSGNDVTDMVQYWCIPQYPVP